MNSNIFKEPFEVQNCQAVKNVADANARAAKQCGSGRLLMQPKYDGFRMIAAIANRKVKLWTRAKKDNSGKAPYIDAELLRIFGDGTVLDGEFVALQYNRDGTIDNGFAHVQSIMLSLRDRAVKVAQLTGRPLDYVIFDVLFLDGEDIRHLPYVQRLAMIQSRIEAAELKPNRVSLSLVVEASDKTHDVMVNQGFEGSVIKHSHAPYSQGKRGRGWYKIKAQPTVDVVIAGFNEGKGKFDGLVGSVIYGQIDASGAFVVRGQCSGMDDATRVWISEHQDELVGTVMEIKHMGVLSDGGFRHPQYSRMRPDRIASDVHWHNG